MDKIVGYSFNQCKHCLECTKNEFGEMGLAFRYSDSTDENSIPYNATDSLGNAVYPIYQMEDFPNSWENPECDREGCTNVIEQIAIKEKKRRERERG